jgi:DNA processing protein
LPFDFRTTRDEDFVFDCVALDPDREPRLRDWLDLQETLGLQPERARDLLEASAGPAEALQHCVNARRSSRREAEARLSKLRRLRVRALPWLSAAYPLQLARLPDAAPLLLLRGAGAVEILEGPCVAIVGARAATVEGKSLAFELGQSLARAGVVVVSGMARGIDAAAHEGALDAKGVSVAVQACGPDRIYPPEHRGLAGRIGERGLVLSEMPLGTPPRAPYFPLRNRLISGLSRAVVVVEAREKSGSLITARHALDQGVEVLAVPGRVAAPTSMGPNRLLIDGARPCLGGDDLLEALGFDAAAPAPAATQPAYGPLATRILAALVEAPATPDELAQRLALSASALAPELLELELAGAIQLERDGRYWVAKGVRGS